MDVQVALRSGVGGKLIVEPKKAFGIHSGVGGNGLFAGSETRFLRFLFMC